VALTRMGQRRRRPGVLAVFLALCALAGACSDPDEVTFSTRSVVSPETAGGEEDASAESVSGGLLPDGGAVGGQQAAGSTTAGRGGGAGASGAGGAAGANSVVKLGTILPLQGGERALGEPVLRTTQAFVDEVNARGGINGHRLQLVAYHSCIVCQGEALQAARRLVEQDGVFALVNTYPMVVAFQSVIPYLTDRGVPLIQGGAVNQTSEALSPTTFVTSPGGRWYAKFLSAIVAERAQAPAVGIVYLNVNNESRLLPILRHELEARGVRVVAEERIEAAEEAVTNMDSVVAQLRAAGAQGVVAMNPAVLIFGRLAARRQQWHVPWTGPAAWTDLVEEGCAATCDEIVFTDTAGLSYTDRDSPQMREFHDTMRRRYPDGQHTGHTLAAWVGMQLFAYVFGRLPGPDQRAFVAETERIRNLDLGTTGPITFGPDRHMGGSRSVILQLRGGKFIRSSDPLDYGESDFRG
jgi:ABC-type branched-subunit amino acid transport system substrate-binding protein